VRPGEIGGGGYPEIAYLSSEIAAFLDWKGDPRTLRGRRRDRERVLGQPEWGTVTAPPARPAGALDPPSPFQILPSPLAVVPSGLPRAAFSPVPSPAAGKAAVLSDGREQVFCNA
jgi:hypothetical protein